MEIIPVIPRGYCQGVVRAIRIARETAAQYPDTPITMLGMIVHNRYVTEALAELGIRCLEEPGKTRLELLDEIDSGVVIFTAHGVSDAVREKAEKKHLTVVDATCPDVTKTHELIKDFSLHGEVLYIGRKGHPEAEGSVSLSSHVHLIQDEKDLEALADTDAPFLITTQTTLSLLESRKLIDACRKKYPHAQVSAEICHATAVRQEAVLNLKQADVLIVVGDPRSNNSNQLKETGLQAGIKKVWMVENCHQLKEKMIKGAKTVAVTSGSSTPSVLCNDVISVLKKYSQTGIWNSEIPFSAPIL